MSVDTRRQTIAGLPSAAAPQRRNSDARRHSLDAASLFSRATNPLKTLVAKAPAISINVEEPAGATAFTSLDRIHGEVVFLPSQDVRFDTISITLEGIVKTYLERMSPATTMASKVYASHAFLNVSQPIDESAFPVPRIAEAGREYRFPFSFVIPERLLPNVCNHKYNSRANTESHLLLPPTLGEAQEMGEGSPMKDDMAPDMARVRYAVKVVVKRISDSGREITVAEKARRVRVVPAYEETPPLDVHENSAYKMEASAPIRRIFRRKHGTITIKAAQPQSLRLLPPRSTAILPTTMATLEVRYEPKHDHPAPKLRSLLARLKTNTFYSVRPMSELPSRQQIIWDPSLGLFTETTKLSQRRLSEVQWNKQADGSYTAMLPIPISLPKGKTYVPTFTSCLVARSYDLCIELGIAAKGSNSLDLRIPIQVSAEGTHVSQILSGITEAAEETEEDFEDFIPRSFAPPPAEAVHSFPVSSLVPVIDSLGELTVEEEAAAAERQLPSHMRVNSTHLPPSDDSLPPGYSFFGRIPPPAGEFAGSG